MAKLNLFQLIHRGNVFVGYILNWSKTRTFWFFIGVLLAIIGYAIYEDYQRKLFEARHQATIAALETKINIKQQEFTELELEANRLDSMLIEERKRLTTVNQTFNQFSRPIINNKDSAASYVLDFIRN